MKNFDAIFKEHITSVKEARIDEFFLGAAIAAAMIGMCVAQAGGLKQGSSGTSGLWLYLI